MTPAQENSSLASQATSGVAWVTAQTWIVKIGGFLTIVVLARLLSPDDFGLVAVALTVLPLVYLLSDLGFGTYLMQAKEVDRVMSSTTFWYSALSSVGLAVVLVAVAPLLERLFGVEGVSAVIAGISPAVVFVGFAAVPVALLRRGMRFRALSIQAGIAALAGQAVAIVMAVTGFGVWSLVAQVCVVQLIILIAAWINSRWMPQRTFSWHEFRSMIGFGSNVLGVNAIALARTWGENAIITNTLGAAALGQLSVAQRLVQTSQEVAGAAISPVSTVAFAQTRDDPPRLRRGYDRALGLVYVLITPALTAILVTAPVLVPFLFGPQWNQAIGVSQALAVAAIFTLGAVLDHGLFYGLGRPGTWLVFALVVDVVTVLATAVTAQFGIIAVGWAFAAVAAVATVARWFLVARAIDASVWVVSRRVLAALVCAAISGALGWGAFLLTADLVPIATLCITGVVILTVHLLVSRVVLASATRELREQISSRLPGPRGRRP